MPSKIMLLRRKRTHEHNSQWKQYHQTTDTHTHVLHTHTTTFWYYSV